VSPSRDSLQTISEEVGGCTRCPLAHSRTRVVPGCGRRDAKVVLIGEAPGSKEDRQGMPFVGASGRRLDSLLKEAMLSREGVFITNIVKCRPPKNRRPTEEEAEECAPFLERQLSLIRPAIIVLLGETALRRFLPRQTVSLAHGRVLDSAGQVFFASYHPAAMIYNRSLERTMREDFKALGSLVSGIR